MENFGQLFRMMRQARGLTLKEATGKEFSQSMLSRFESGQAEMSAQKLSKCLEHIYLEPEEFNLLVRDFEPSDMQRLLRKIHQYCNPFDKEKLLLLSQKELEKIEQDNRQKYHFLNHILIQARIKSFDETHEIPQKSIDYLKDYLFSMDKWASYELILFSETLHLFDSRAYLSYCREMLHRSDFFNQLLYNSNLIQTILINGIFYLTEKRTWWLRLI